MASSVLMPGRILSMGDWEGQEELLRSPRSSSLGACSVLLHCRILALEPEVGLGGKGGTFLEPWVFTPQDLFCTAALLDLCSGTWGGFGRKRRNSFGAIGPHHSGPVLYCCSVGSLLWNVGWIWEKMRNSFGALGPHHSGPVLY